MENVSDLTTIIPDEPERGMPVWVSGIGRFFLREVLGTVLPAVLIALVINLFLAQATVVRGQSMEPTLCDSERVVVEKITYRFLHGPRRGDVIVLRVTGQDDLLIKRVIALPGEKVAVQGGKVYINDQPLDESWTFREGGLDYAPTLIPPLHVFVMGDNRGHSNDSRSFGPVPVDQIFGRAWMAYWPLERVGRIR
jgi:signal peptidase I